MHFKSWVSDMGRYVLLLFFLLCGFARAEDSVTSCNGLYRAQIVRPGVLRIEGGEGRREIKIGHNILGGDFDSSESYLVLYGMPNKIDPVYPQVNYLTVYRVRGMAKMVARRTYGGGVYSAKFSADGNLISIDDQYGVDVFDLNKKKFESHEIGYVPNFPLHECLKN
ncbi:hypothetical protein [Burkholderia ubonensis]|uniref:hypothetical protein n=1 Tax=Burkholderia ubonensis TaxID=101571 RepID=UPI002ABD49B1|nr:hypothetical protein [Burkholderia ubonensis]